MTKTTRIFAVLIALQGIVFAGCQTMAAKAKEAKAREDAARKASVAARTSPYGTGSLGRKPGRNPDIYIPRGDVPGGVVSYSKANIREPYVAMTFDDGPHPEHTPRLLNILAERNIKATFFVVGTNAKNHPQILRRMINEGHEIGNHTRTHAYLNKLSDSQVREELSSCHNTILAATGIPPKTLRPPYGAITSRQKSWIYDEFNYPSILWSVDPRDWQRPGAGVVADRIVSGTTNGAIILAHDIHKPTIDAMERALDRLLAKGFRFVTVTQLLELERRGKLQTSASAQ